MDLVKSQIHQSNLKMGSNMHADEWITILIIVKWEVLKRIKNIWNEEWKILEFFFKGNFRFWGQNLFGRGRYVEYTSI